MSAVTRSWARPVTVLATLLCLPAALGLLLFGLILWTGCFPLAECSPPDRVNGAWAFAGAAALSAVPPALAAMLVRQRSWVVGTLAWPAAALVAIVGVVAVRLLLSGL
jgi:hypothetical protein